MKMTPKQRILAAVRKQPVDEVPFAARIDLWYNYHTGHNTLPEKYKGFSIPDILHNLKAGMLLSCPPVVKTEYRNVEISVKENPPFKITEYKTPKGTVSVQTIYTPEEGQAATYEVDHLFKSEKDYPALEYMMENAVVVGDLSNYVKMQEAVGEDGIVMSGLASPMQEIMRDIMGFERFFYELYDHPAKVERLFDLAKALGWQKLQILGNSTMEIAPVCANWADEVHTPVFKRFFIPWLQEANRFLHSKGKLTRIHIDGEIKRLISMIPETGIDVAEAWTPSPMTSVTTEELRKAWGDRMTIFGGIPAILFEPQYSDKEFDDYIINLFREIAPGNNFIIGFGDNLGSAGDIKRVGRVAELVKQYGRFPISVQ